jgi:imidazole glycerol-phosphate synthase subunit HisH
MQVLASSGEEMGEHEGLGWIPGRVKRLAVEDKGLRVPHVGWNEIRVTGTHPVLTGFRKDANFYFVHSYMFVPDSPEHTAAVCDYGGEFTCAVAKDNIIAAQFHPEKSQQNGLAVLERFLAWKP